MHASTLLTLAAPAAAYISGMVAPATASAGQTIQAELNTSIYIQNWDDFGVVWGLVSPNNACKGCVGRRVGYTNLFGDHPDATLPASGSGSFEVPVTIPAGQAPGEYVLVAGASYLVGASGLTGFNYYNTSITIQ